jgi:hypothetical protein
MGKGHVRVVNLPRRGGLRITYFFLEWNSWHRPRRVRITEGIVGVRKEGGRLLECFCRIIPLSSGGNIGWWIVKLVTRRRNWKHCSHIIGLK